MIIESNNSNQYLLSEEEKQIFFFPNHVNATYYQQKKHAFMKSHNLFSPYRPNLTPNYSSQQLKANLANLRMVIIEVTDQCNLSCEYCGYGKLYNNYDERKGTKQKFSNVKLLVDYLAEFWNSPLNVSYNNEIGISFYGGEPLIGIQLIKETISYLESLPLKKALNFAYYMTTNAFLLDKYMDFLVEKKFHLLLSLDGDKKNNSYRTMLNGKSSFEKVFENIQALQMKYPLFFETNVEFNAVLHNRNSVQSTYHFIKNTFGKVPTIAELNSNGIAEEKRNEFMKIYKNRLQDTANMDNCEGMNDDMLTINPQVVNFGFFIDAFLSNTYQGYTDLFIDESKQQFIPTGTCQPFKRKLFLTVNNKILSCERVGQSSPLGKIADGKVMIDFDLIRDFYARMYKDVIPQCRNCVMWKNCTLCVYYIKEVNGHKRCERFLPRNKSGRYFSENLSLVEANPSLYKNIIKEIDQY